jgi:flagellar motility protein MotE (MotC chaperone)
VYATNGTYTLSPNNSISSATLELQGEGADVRINGVSLTGVLKNIEERLNILRPNAELETEWHQLKELGDQYRALEAELKEKSKMWEKLKAMPPVIG